MENSKVKRIYVGEVISDKMNKTRVVKVQRTFMNSRFKKVVRSFKKYKVHDESNASKVGDKIEFYEGRPVSKTKFMYLHRVINVDLHEKEVAR